MKKCYTSLLTVLLIGTVSCLCSCYGTYVPDPYIVSADRQKENVYHIPSVQNVPLLHEQKDLNLSFQLGYTNGWAGFGLQSAYVPLKHFGVMANYNSLQQRKDQQRSVAENYEGGAGYENEWGNLHFETYAGLGGGGTENIHHTGRSKINFANYFLQPAFGVHNADNTVQFAFVSKFNFCHLTVADTAYNGGREPIVAGQFKLIDEHPNHLFWEPGLVFRAGWKNFLLQSAFSVSSNLSGNDFFRDKYTFSVGTVLRVNTGDKAKNKR